MKRRIVMLLIGASLVLSACGGGAKKDTTQTSSQPAVESVAQESVVSEESVQESVVQEAESLVESVVEGSAEADPDDLADDNPLKLMSLALRPLTAPPFPLEYIRELTEQMGGQGSMD